MSILAKIEAAVEPTVVVVEHQGEKYTLSGTPDAALYGDIFLLDPEQINNRVTMWRQFVGEHFSVDLFPHVVAVARTLHHEKDPAARYEEHEIAILATRDLQLFLLLMNAAYQCLGFGETSDAIETVQAAALKNSPSDQPHGSLSKSRASKRADKPQGN
jgi:hypothetical protein